MYKSYTTDQPGVSVGHSAGALASIIVFGFFDMVNVCMYDALSR
jgi:hypothetical protein